MTFQSRHAHYGEFMHGEGLCVYVWVWYCDKRVDWIKYSR